MKFKNLFTRIFILFVLLGFGSAANAQCTVQICGNASTGMEVMILKYNETWTTGCSTAVIPVDSVYYTCVRFGGPGSSIFDNGPYTCTCKAPTMAAPTVNAISCTTGTGSIVVNATAANVNPLEYSINGGSSWQASNTFSGLGAGSYNIQARVSGAMCAPNTLILYSGNPVVLTTPVCRDFTPTIEIDNVTFVNNSPARDFIINVQEIQNGASSGQLQIKIPKITGFTYTFPPTMTSANVLGGTPVSNGRWAKTENSTFITLTLKAGEVLAPYGISAIGMTVQRNGSVPIQTNQPITATIVDFSGGDTDRFNNTYNVIIKAQ